MTYPLSPLVELYLDGAWTDVTTDGGSTQVYQRDDIVMRWGRANEESAVPPSSTNLTFNNRSGKFSPRNPRSSLYGKIGRNTPARVRLGTSSRSLELPGVAGSYASTPDHSSLDITGDIDLRIDLQPETWRPIEPTEHALLMSKYEVTGDQRSWLFMVRSDGLLRLWISSAGTFASAFAVSSTVAVPDDGARRAVRATVDVDNGASGNTITFYTAPTLGGAWTQLGDPVVTAGTTSIFSSTTPVEVGTGDGGTTPFTDTPPIPAAVWAAQIRNGINGTVVANPDFTAPHAGDTTLTDSAGRLWTVRGGAGITDTSVRGAGEISVWPQRWDVSGNDVWTQVQASGIRRRLGQGAPTLRSAMYRGMTGGNITPPRGYWPCEDGEDATTLASAFDGHPRMSAYGEVALAAFSDAPASDAIPTITTGTLHARVPDYPASNFLRLMVFANIPATITGEPIVLELVTTGTAERWRLSINSTGGLRLRAYIADGTEILDSTMGFAILGERGLLWLYLVQNGSAVDHQTGWMREGSDVAGVADATLTGRTKGDAVRFGIGTSGDLQGMAVGHATVLDTNEFWDIATFAKAWAGETAAHRITRLCAEENVPLRIIGPASGTQRVGPQRIGTFLDLVDGAAAADLGILADDRDAIRLLFRPGRTLYNQDAALTLDYDTGQVAGSLEPVEDDQLTRNDFTVQRTGGSSARAVLESGPLSIQPPPAGVGRYDDTVTVNLRGDGQLQQHAAWLLHLGTVDEARYPHIAVNLARDTGLSAAATAVKVGDRLQVTNPPAWLPPEAIDQLAQGGVETLNRYRHAIVYNCAPGSPWTVAVAGDAELGRADTAGSQLAAGATAAATTLKVLTTLGPMWIEDAAEFPFDVQLGGEVVTVSGIVAHILDRFTRTVANGWGAADSGEGWVLAGGAASDYSVNGTRGLVSLGSVAVSRRTILPIADRDFDIMASVATDKVATGNWITAGLVARRVTASDFYQARVEFKHDGNVGIGLYRTVAGSGVALTAGHVLGSYAANERFNVRFAVIGSALNAKIWRVGTPEPAWQLVVTDTNISTTGHVATHNELLTDNTNTLPVIISWDDLTSKAQKFTVARAVNGISKAQTAGADVSLAQPAIAAL